MQTVAPVSTAVCCGIVTMKRFPDRLNRTKPNKRRMTLTTWCPVWLLTLQTFAAMGGYPGMSPPVARRRYAIVGTGARAEMYARALAVEHADTGELAALADLNSARTDAHNRQLVQWGAAPAALNGGGPTGLGGGNVIGASLHGAEAAAEHGWVRLQVRPYWQPPVEVDLGDLTREGHGGADALMTATLFGASPQPDPLGRGATERDGARSLLTGLAANASLDSGQPVRVADLLDVGGL
jgi:hypothetical protein